MASSTTTRVRIDELFVRWQRDREPRAGDALVAQFLPLARALARRYAGRETLDDLVQVASVGLLKAIDRFDPDRGLAFTTFAVPTILGELKRHFRDTGWFVHVPRGMQNLVLQVKAAEQQCSAQTGRSPTPQQLAQYLEVSLEEVTDALEAARANLSASLDAILDDAEWGGLTLAETLGRDDERYEQVDCALTIRAAARDLSAIERLVLARYFVQEQTQAQIGTELGVSQMQVSRILRRTIVRLQELTGQLS
ncbi:MAG: SigB/SigF/SigG family RNA polymerase sigma factor [Solirubrobacteraceae bacterium]